MTGGILLGVVGVWVLTQVLAGNALGRLGITSSSTSPAQAAPSPVAPGAPQVTVPPNYLGGF